MSSARNVGIEKISAELCYFLDSDDYIESDILEYAVKIFENFDVDYFCFGSEAFCEEESVRNLDKFNNCLRVKYDGYIDLKFDIGSNTNIHVWNKVFKTSIIKKYNIKFIDKLLYEDIYFMWFYFFVSKKAYYDKAIYHYYRMCSNSVMEGVTANKTYETGIPHLYNWHELMISLSKNRTLFLDKYKNILSLLESYKTRTKNMIPPKDKYKAELLCIKYKEEIETIYKNFLIEIENEEKEKLEQLENLKNKNNKELNKYNEYSFYERIFSIKNEDVHKVLFILGIKLKFKSKTLEERKMIKNIETKINQVNSEIKSLKNIVNKK